MTEQAVEALERCGFSTYEARVYIGLLRQNPVTGYQLSKSSGVPRSRIYETLERLITKGYAVALKSEPAEYRPLAADELVANLKEQLSGNLTRLESELRDLSGQKSTENVWNLRGREAVLLRARSMIAHAEESAYLVGWGETLMELEPELEAASGRGVRVVTISCGECALKAGIHYHHAFEAELVQHCDTSLNVVTDGMEVLVGQTEPAATCEAAWSHSAALVLVTEEYIRHEVYLHKIIQSFGASMSAELKDALSKGLEEVPHA